MNNSIQCTEYLLPSIVAMEPGNYLSLTPCILDLIESTMTYSVNVQRRTMSIAMCNFQCDFQCGYYLLHHFHH